MFNLGDVGTLLIGVGAVGTFVQSSRNHRVAKRVETSVTDAAVAAGTAAVAASDASGVVNEVKASVGEANGQTLTQLANHIVSLVEYTHKRNHDIMNGQAQTNLALFAISKQLEKLVEKAG
jgi:hypothetical protein